MKNKKNPLALSLYNKIAGKLLWQLLLYCISLSKLVKYYIPLTLINQKFHYFFIPSVNKFMDVTICSSNLKLQSDRVDIMFFFSLHQSII